MFAHFECGLPSTGPLFRMRRGMRGHPGQWKMLYGGSGLTDQFKPNKRKFNPGNLYFRDFIN